MKRTREHTNEPTLPLAKDLSPAGLLQPKHIEALHRDGYCVVEGVLTAEQCATTRRQWLETIENYDIGFVANDPESWKAATHRPVGTHGMHDYPPVAQEWWVWNARLHTASVFSQLWQTPAEDLISSMDRVCFVPPTQPAIANDWWHLDQCQVATRGALACVQGMLVVEDIDEGDIALEVMAGAHRLHAEFLSYLGKTSPVAETRTRTMDWYQFAAADVAWFANSGLSTVRRVHAKKGSLILWDSRLPHQARGPRDGKRSDRARHTIYTCMVPRAWADYDCLDIREELFEDGRATTHWPQYRYAFAATPQTYGQPLPTFPGFELEKQLAMRDNPEYVPQQQLMKRLVGY